MTSSARTDRNNGSTTWAPAVYTELRRIAAAQMARLPAASTLQPTALVHEAWMRLKKAQSVCLDEMHLISAAAEAMRHILIDRARRRSAARHGGESRRVALLEMDLPLCLDNDEHLVALDSALRRMAEEHPDAAQLIELHCFAGLEIAEAANALGLTRATAYRRWLFARTWLYTELTS